MTESKTDRKKRLKKLFKTQLDDIRIDLDKNKTDKPISDKTLIEKKLDTYLNEDELTNKVKNGCKLVYSKMMSCNNINDICYYSSLFPVITSTILSGRDISKVKILIS